MIKRLKKEIYRLEAEGIDQISEEIGANLRKYPDLSRKDILRLRLSAEDILMHWMGVAKDLTIELLIEEHGREVNITMSLDGITYKKDPLEMSGAEGMGMVDNMMAALGIGWLYQFDRGRNIIYTTVTTSHRNQAAELGVTLLCAVISVILLRLAPQSFTGFVQKYVLDFLFNYGSRFLTAIVSPMMFLAVVGGVLSVGSPRYLQEKGQYVCRQFLWSTFTVIVTAGVVCMIAFSFHPDFSVETGIRPVAAFLSEIVPDNVISPFLEGNMIQIILMGVIVGIAMLYLQRQVRTLNRFVEEGNALICKIISGFETGILVFIYLSMVNMGLTTDLHKILAFVKVFILFVLFIFLAVYVQLSMTAKRTGIPKKDIWSKLKETAMAQLNSASSSVAFTGAYDACESAFGIDKKLVGFALPVGTVIHKPFIAAEFVFMIAAAKTAQGDGLNISSMLLLMFLAFVVSIAYPPVSGGEITCYTILLTQMGLPASFLAFACALSSIFDILESPANTLSTEFRLLMTAQKMREKEQ